MAERATVTATTMAWSATKGRRPAWGTGLLIENDGRPAQNDEVVSVTASQAKLRRVLVCLDTSMSMVGELEIVAKAATLARGRRPPNNP